MHKSVQPTTLRSPLLRSTRRRKPFLTHITCSKTTDKATSQDRKSLKDNLKRAVANTNRGKNTTAQQQSDILQTVEKLEAASPTSDPAVSDLLSGKWSLLYTGPGRAGDVDWEKRTGGVEGPFLAFFRPLTANAVRSRGITQIIDSERGSVENLAEFRVANAFDGALNVAGTVTPVRPPGGDAESVRVDVRFTSFSLKLGALPTLTIPLTWPKAPLGFVDTTYLDEDFRVGRGDKGSVFVTACKQ